MLSPLVSVIVLHEILDPPHESRRQRKRRVVLPCFDRIDRLARDIEVPGKLRLAPAAFGAQYSQAVFQVSLALHYVSETLHSESCGGVNNTLHLGTVKRRAA